MPNTPAAAQATPRPWKVDDSNPFRVTSSATPVAECGTNIDYHDDVSRANAELIVRAVNSWDDPEAIRARYIELSGPNEVDALGRAIVDAVNATATHDQLVAALEVAQKALRCVGVVPDTNDCCGVTFTCHACKVMLQAEAALAAAKNGVSK